MTQPAEAVGGTPAEPIDATEAFTKLAAEEFGINDEEEPAPIEGEPTDELTEDEPEVEEEADDLPPIDAPVSWDAEAKEVFKSLPRDAQEIVQKREADRERFVSQKSQEAARAKSEAEQSAHQQLAEIEGRYSQQYSQAAQILDQLSADPDYSLLATNPAEFARQAEVAKHFRAQRDQAQRNAEQYATQAQQRVTQLEQAQLAEQHKIIVENFPEYADPTTGPELQRKLSATAKRIGYPDELISQARATDIIAMKKVADAFDKADKYDGLMSKQMVKVRAAKGLPRVATPGVAVGSDQQRAKTAQAAIDTAMKSKDRNVQGAAFFDYLSKTGQI